MTNTEKILAAAEELLAKHVPALSLPPATLLHAAGDSDVSSWVGYESTHPLTWLLDANDARACPSFD